MSKPVADRSRLPFGATRSVPSGDFTGSKDRARKKLMEQQAECRENRMRTPKSAQTSSGLSVPGLPRRRLTWTARKGFAFGHWQRTTHGQQGWRGSVSRQRGRCAGGAVPALLFCKAALEEHCNDFLRYHLFASFWVKPPPRALSIQDPTPAC